MASSAQSPLGDVLKAKSVPWLPIIGAVGERFDKEYQGQSFDLPEEVEAMEQRQVDESRMNMQHDSASAMPEQQSASQQAETFVREQPKVGRNDPCPCGSGKKFKQCHGKITQ